MNINRMLAFALVGAVALTGCVSVEKTREQIKSSNKEEVKKGEDTIYWAATVGRDATGFVVLTTKEKVEYVELTDNQDLLLKIIDNSNNGDVIESATERIDFSKSGVAKEFVLNRFSKISCIQRYERKNDGYGGSEDVSYKVQKKLKTKIISQLSETEILELVGDKKREKERFENERKRYEAERLSRGQRPMMAVRHGDEITDEDRDLLIDRLISITSSPDVLWKIKQGDIRAESKKVAAEQKLLTLLDKVTDPQMVEQLLTAYDQSGMTLVEKGKDRLVLVKKLPENKMVEMVLSDITKHSIYSWNKGDLAALEMGVGIMLSIKDTKTILKIASSILTKIAEYRKECSNSFMMSWDASDENKVRKLLGQLPKLSNDALTALVCLDSTSWRYFMGSVTADVAYGILTLGKAKSAELEEALVKKLPADKIDMKVYNGVQTDAGKKAVLAVMPAELKKSAQESVAKVFSVVLEKAKAAAKETFELDGFYLGMDWNDMKHVLSHHFPDYVITEARDGDEKDADYVIYVPKQSTPFCYASAKDKKVYQFNFGKVMLKKWYKYDVLTFAEWVHAYERETKIDMKFKIIDKDTTVYEPMNMSRSYKVWFHQESYQYKHNTQDYRLTYFGEEKDFTLEGGIGGAIIKEIAAPRFRYVRGDPGMLRAIMEND